MKMWYDYYSKHFDDSGIYIINNRSTIDGQYDGIGGNIEVADHVLTNQERQHGICDSFITQPKIRKFRDLLGSYEYVMVADTDEFVVPDPEKYPGGLKEFIDGFKGEFAQCKGYNVLDNGVPFDPSKKPWLS